MGGQRANHRSNNRTRDTRRRGQDRRYDLPLSRNYYESYTLLFQMRVVEIRWNKSGEEIYRGFFFSRLNPWSDWTRCVHETEVVERAKRPGDLDISRGETRVTLDSRGSRLALVWGLG